jgi:uncharacterized membrane protein YbhN (UPF0104 family)
VNGIIVNCISSLSISSLRRRLPRGVVAVLILAVTALSIAAIWSAVDGEALARAARTARGEPLRVSAAVGAFGAAFVFRAAAWRRVLPGLRFGHALSGIHLALGGNHLLPLRLGEPMRVLSVVRRAGVSIDAATASTVALRSADLLAVVALGLIAGPAALAGLSGWSAGLVFGGVAAAALAAWLWLWRLAGHSRDVRLPGPAALGLTVASWLCEAVLVWQAAHWAGLEITAVEAVGVAAVSVAAQVAAIAPGGFGTYEAAAVAAYVVLGHDAGDALVAALAAHALKTAYSLVAGATAVFVPSPGLAGRLRLRQAPSTIDRRPERSTMPAELPGDAPVVLFMPAHNEQESVGDCVRRAPAEVLGRPVAVLVIDDGSTDATAARARAAGAEVISLNENRGLGAAVRVGLAAGVRQGAAAVAFCDADGEYPPEELAALVEPVLAGQADYVAGSRFRGQIHHMRPHRRFGNLVLTAALSLVARQRISDGQTGYRAFSRAAAADAEIIHDYNYAQVLTLDLLAKGYRYAEVPISYRFRTTGQSFVKLGSYLRNVVPAVYRELNTAA